MQICKNASQKSIRTAAKPETQSETQQSYRASNNFSVKIDGSQRHTDTYANITLCSCDDLPNIFNITFSS